MHRNHHHTIIGHHTTTTRIPAFTCNILIKAPRRNAKAIVPSVANCHALPLRSVHLLQRLHEQPNDDDPFNFADDEYYDDDDDGDDDGTNEFGIGGISGGGDGSQFIPVDDAEISDELLRDVEGGKPSEWLIMKDILGINIFTYILAGLIALFLSLNFLLGPGWLGQQIGFGGTGTFTQISDSLPDSVDLSGAENLL